VVVAANTTINVDPEVSTYSSLGQMVEINVTISQVSDLAGWEFRLFYPSSILNATDITEGPFLGAMGSTFLLVRNFTDDYNATHGLIWTVCTLIGTGPGATGNGTLATVRFVTKALGEAVLHLTGTDLVDSNMPPLHISHLANDGMVQFDGMTDLAVNTVYLVRTIVGQGYVIPVSVTVGNLGNYPVTFNVSLQISRPRVETVNIALFGSTGKGWGFTQNNITSPGPMIRVKQWEVVNLTLTSSDAVRHNFFVDYDNNSVPSYGEPTSPDFPGPPYWDVTINHQFVANTVGVFKYYCEYDEAEMFGDFIVEPPDIMTIEVARQELSLDNATLTNVVFGWNTSTSPYGRYDVSAYAWPIPGETNIENNLCTDGQVFVTLPGDVTADRRVSMDDIVALIRAFGSTPARPDWNVNYDIDDNKKVDMGDIIIALKNFGKSWQ
jgi:hypothetical protein